MPRVRLTIVSDYSELEDELDRLDDLPDAEAAAALGLVLSTAFAATQAETHVITGSLRNSGRAEAVVHGREWEGEITYGGPSPGYPNDPVNYATYERARGDTHDFMRSVYLFRDAFADAVAESLDR